jgi:sn-glycerol 3-phosphate transport system permease protein
MVERGRFGDLIPHLILLIVGVCIVAFPVYLCSIGSTHEQSVIANGQMPITPGALFWQTYYKTMFVGTSGTTREPVERHAAQQLQYGQHHRRRQDRHLDHLGLRRGLLQLPVPHDGVLADLHDADAARRGAHLPDLQDCRLTCICSTPTPASPFPLIASATATLFFRQFFMTIPTS